MSSATGEVKLAPNGRFEMGPSSVRLLPPPLGNQPETKSRAASAASAAPPAEPARVVSLLISKDGKLMLDRREQTLESLQSELRSLQSASGSLVVRVSAPETVPAARVIEVVDACRAAGVTRFSLGIPAEDEAPVLHLTDPPKPPANATASATNLFYTRTFKVEPHTLAAGLESVAGGPRTNLTAQDQLRWLLASAGLDFAPTNAAAADKPPARALFYSDRNGLLLVRATMPELATVEQLLQVLNTAQPQVMIEAKFVEVSADANAPHGFDWYLGNVQMGTNQLTGTAPAGTNGLFPGPGVPSAGISTGNVGTITNLLTDPQFRDATAALDKAGTNGVRELRGDQLAWPGRDATNAANIRVTAAQGATVTGILTDPQYRVVLRALEQRAGVDVLSTPKVVTLSAPPGADSGRRHSHRFDRFEPRRREGPRRHPGHERAAVFPRDHSDRPQPRRDPGGLGRRRDDQPDGHPHRHGVSGL